MASHRRQALAVCDEGPDVFHNTNVVLRNIFYSICGVFYLYRFVCVYRACAFGMTCLVGSPPGFRQQPLPAYKGPRKDETAAFRTGRPRHERNAEGSKNCPLAPPRVTV